jgi:hypothetical protein
MNASMHAALVLGKPLPSTRSKHAEQRKPYARAAQAVHHTSEPDNHDAAGVSCPSFVLLIVYARQRLRNQGFTPP